MKIFTVGASGMVGSRIIELLSNKYSFDDLSLTNGVDITNPQTLEVFKNDTQHEVIIHLAAKADVDGCELDKQLGTEGAAYKINVGGTQNVVDACLAGKKKLLYISTDFVFDGDDTPDGGYTEEDSPNPINWYAKTKYEGEEIIKNSGLEFLIFRIAFPYRKSFELKKDFVRAIVSRLEEKQPVRAITDQLFTPTFIDDIALAVDTVLNHNVTGIYHVVGSQSLSPYDAALKIAKAFNYDPSLVKGITAGEYFAGRAPRPFNLSLNNAKIEALGITMKSFDEGLRELI